MRPLRTLRLLPILLLVLPPFAAADVTLFAAASLTDVATALAQRFTEKTGIPVHTAFAASSTLARQIEAGAPADVYISANRDWMQYLAERGLVKTRRERDPVANALVVIAPRDDDRVPAAVDVRALARALPPGERLAVGDPAHVPAGEYAREALTRLGEWPALQPRLARSDNVRAALALVARGEAPLGIVYATDAAIDDSVRVVGTFPADSHDPITYPVGTVSGRETPQTRAFLAFIETPEAAALWRRYGFLVSCRRAGDCPPAP